MTAPHRSTGRNLLAIVLIIVFVLLAGAGLTLWYDQNVADVSLRNLLSGAFWVLFFGALALVGWGIHLATRRKR